jgi:hypothetical protein
MALFPKDEVNVEESSVINRHCVDVVHKQVDDVAFDPVVGDAGYSV